jgi:hypothetical protein
MPTTVIEETRSPKDLLYVEISKDSEKYTIYLKSSEIVKITKNLFGDTVNVGEHKVYWNENMVRKVLKKIYGWGNCFIVDIQNSIIINDIPNLIPLMDTRLGEGTRWEILLSDVLITKKEINLWSSELERIAKFLYNTYGEEYKKVIRISIETL